MTNCNLASRIVRHLPRALLMTALVGCAGVTRECSSCAAGSLGADWVVVQMDNDGRPYRCWDLHDVSVAVEGGDGVVWMDTTSSNLIHISGHFNRVQVVGGNWDRAYATLGLTKETCAEVRGQLYDPTARQFRVRSAEAGR